MWFSEVSPRPHDTGPVTLTTQWQHEFELHARAFLGLPVDTSLRNTGASAVVYGGVDAVGITFDGIEEALAVPGVDLRLFGSRRAPPGAGWVSRSPGWTATASRPPGPPPGRPPPRSARAPGPAGRRPQGGRCPQPAGGGACERVPGTP